MWCCSAAVIKYCSSKSCNTATQQYLNNFKPTINVAGKLNIVNPSDRPGSETAVAYLCLWSLSSLLGSLS
jgi:hypothetical protein